MEVKGKEAVSREEAFSAVQFALSRLLDKDLGACISRLTPVMLTTWPFWVAGQRGVHGVVHQSLKLIGGWRIQAISTYEKDYSIV